MKIGDRVRVRTSVIVYHHPEHRNQPFDIQGMEGEITAILSDWEGRVISPNYPFQIKFDKKFRTHLGEQELELA
ncbi:ferredoxin-thioredoxin reductase variable chain [Lyngbya confervoides]|uniref:Ferredoxin-thioredoxin reductase variable chain n=1 Tax=Lyngbya confervoides BDU141951 TaxID=1574623 RepID=A0ABD4T521_9CYAN|nr:ferredoxin-thioredoxin reductase variable chain [Lyngbya confervoides]MCM1983617.1 ferredoxin-thioredoxin reductase variable chain [Lyngbya confervoides BDU141951]